jgi:peptidoglycan/xylan/chitin deacetylase (PgdA/CDA1 family)
MNLSGRVSSWAARNLPMTRVRSQLECAVASVTFDDFPKSAWINGGPILDGFKARATYYVAGSFCGHHYNGIEYFDADDLLAVQAAGHELGSHTFSHVNVPTISSSELLKDAKRNSDFVRDILVDTRLSSFAYPYGVVSVRTKLLFSRLFPSCRGNTPGVNGRTVDLGQLSAVPLYSSTCGPDVVERLVAEAKAVNGWIIFYSHDVSDNPTPWGCTPGLLEKTLRLLKNAQISVLPVKHALARTTSSSNA